MTPQGQKNLRTALIIVGVGLIVTAATILIVKKIRADRDAREALELSNSKDSAAPTPKTTPTTTKPSTSSSSGSTSTFQGRTFTKLEVEKMQSCLLTMGTIWSCPDIVDAIRNTGGIDGKIGSGFQTAYNLAVEYGLIADLDTLYVQATKV